MVALSSGEVEVQRFEFRHLRDDGRVQFLLDCECRAKGSGAMGPDSIMRKSVASRRGMSHVANHIQVRYLCFPDLVAAGVARLRKAPSRDNLAGLHTTLPPVDTLRHLCEIHNLKSSVVRYHTPAVLTHCTTTALFTTSSFADGYNIVCIIVAACMAHVARHHMFAARIRSHHTCQSCLSFASCSASLRKAQPFPTTHSGMLGTSPRSTSGRHRGMLGATHSGMLGMLGRVHRSFAHQVKHFVHTWVFGRAI